MGFMDIKIKLMPSSVETDLEEIKKVTGEIIQKWDGNSIKFEEEPIAFGLKAINVMFILNEEKELEPLEKELGEIENVNSEEIVYMRRALG
ncbi:elongation factor 1-beta [Candidatus Pacearchaeota archaeon CG10_big_fil_rev_8_21_14_0_10_34_12]|nr:MAG: elongation factor 1-beta [Candidatus Pacearchaeota archaeon CG10_big_fil_rev_8_21_14_0_10_34_12]